MTALQQQITDWHDTTYELAAAWDDLTVAVARQLEGWNDPASRVANALKRVRLATGAANAALDRALAEGGE